MPIRHPVVAFATLLLACGAISSCADNASATTSASATTAAETSPANVVALDKDADFEGLTAKGLVVVDFYATWCGPCSQLAPQLDAVAKGHLGKMTVVRVDVDKHPDIAQRFKVDAIPNLVIFRDGKQTDSQVGYQDSAALTTWLKL